MLDEFPDSHLAQIAHAGMDAILVMTCDKDRSLRGHTDFNDLIRRAAKWGIDVYAYSYYRSLCHPDDPAADAHYESTYGALFRQCPGLKGVVLVGESVGFPTKDPKASPLPYDNNHIDGIPADKPSADFWPCKDYAEWLVKIKSIIHRYNPDADIVFWTYNWGYANKQDRQELIRRMPKDVSLLVTFETFEPLLLSDDVYEQVYDYTLAFAGPGQYFISEAEVAHECGIRLYAMTNTAGSTWDMGGIPYLPMPHQWQNRVKAVMEAAEKYGIAGTMEGHQYGFTPSMISELVKYTYDTGITETDNELVRIIRRHYGAGHEKEIISALEKWSEAIRMLPPSGEEQTGAFRVGPSFPFSISGTYKHPADESSKGYFMCAAYVPHNGSHQSSVAPSGVRLPYQRARLVTMLELLAEGRKQLEAIGYINEEFSYLINLGHFMECFVLTGINAKDWYKVVAKLPVADSREEVERLISEGERILKSERENVERAIPLVQRDSRLGWDPRMEYVCDPDRLEWKLRLLDYVQTTELDQFRKPNRWTFDS
jgi:sugar phosphate isomerase/epimerase